ncbi:mitochondrial carrier domain-containing protein [Hyaloraphidium curvatum]|nr:mitochondrial carrier domain-containing protein [Hyaloraphidium curvatum]
MADADGGSFLTFAGIRFASTALLSPLENAKILQQVSHIPSDDFMDSVGRGGPSNAARDNGADEPGKEANDDGSEVGRQSQVEEADDQSIPSSDLSDSISDSTVLNGWAPLPVDPMGYLFRASFDEDDPARPPYQMKPQDGGLMSTAGQVLDDEGVLSLWKGNRRQLSNWTYEMLSVLMQPTLEGFFNETCGLPDDSIPLVHLDSFVPNLLTHLGSHILTGVVLSPIELVRTRLVVQSASARYRKYNGLVDGLSKVAAEEGLSVVFSPPLLTATVLYHALTCVFRSSPPILITRVLGISSQDAPVLFALCELAINTAELLFVLPVETARRRLMCQPRPRFLVDNAPFRPLVELRPLPYTGIWDCMARIVVEEGGVSHKRGSKGKRRPSAVPGGGPRPWWDGFGLKGLYRGIREHFWATVGLLVVSAALAIDEHE